MLEEQKEDWWGWTPWETVRMEGLRPESDKGQAILGYAMAKS